MLKYNLFHRNTGVRFNVVFFFSCLALLALLAVLTQNTPVEAMRMCAGCVQ